jgi:type I restriction enzyme M protein
MTTKVDIDFTQDLFEAANKMRGSIAPADYKHIVLPLIFLRYLSLIYEKRRQEEEETVSKPNSELYMEDEEMRQEILSDPDQYISERV